MGKKLLFVHFLCFFLHMTLFGDVITINNEHFQDILPKSEIYIDKTQKLTIGEITKQAFQKNDLSLLGFGYAPKLSVWIKFQLENSTDMVMRKIIEYDNPLTTHIEFYEVSQNGIKSLKEGSFQKDEKRFTLNPVFHIELEPNTKKTYFIKTSSYITALIIKLNLWEIESFFEQEIKKQFVFALFFGAMAILALYNLFIYFITRDISYMFYVMYIVGLIIHQLLYVGVANIYLFNTQMTQIITSFAVLAVAFPIYSLALFTKTFLYTKQYPIWDKILNVFLVVIPVFVLLVLVTDIFDQYRTFVIFSLFVYLIALTIYATFKKNKQAYYILFGWSVIFVGAIIMVLSSSGILNIEDFPYVVEIAFVMEALVFSIALAAKIKTLQKQKLQVKRQLIEQQEKEKIHLEEEVDKKTKELQNLNQNLEEKVKEEVDHVKRIERKLFEAEKMAAMGEMIGNIAHQWRQPLSVISTEASGMIMKKDMNLLDDTSLHQSLEHIVEMTEHLSQTINDFRDYIKGEMVKSKFYLSSCIKKVMSITGSSLKANAISQILDLDDSIVIDSYENALIQSLVNIINNAKDVLKEQESLEEKCIFIKTVKKEKGIVLMITDNAGGIKEDIIHKIFDPYFTTKQSSHGTGLGLHMTKNMITTTMEGTIEVNNEKFHYNEEEYVGARFIITLPHS